MTRSLDALQTLSAAWGRRNLRGDSAERRGLVLAEEAGEVARAILKRAEGIRGSYDDWTAEIRKESGDALLVLCRIAAEEGFSLLDAGLDRYEAIATRDLNHDPVQS